MIERIDEIAVRAPPRAPGAPPRCGRSFLEATADVERAIDAEEAHLSRSLGNREVLALVRLMKSLVILTPPLAVAGYWGMNVPVPWSHEPWAFAAIIVVSILSSFVCALELRRRRWM